MCRGTRSCDVDGARPDAHAPLHPQSPLPTTAALPALDALPSNEGVLVVQLPRQLPWQRAVVHAVDVQPGAHVLVPWCLSHPLHTTILPGDVLHDGDVLAHVLLGGTACAPILARLHPASSDGACSYRVQRVCLHPGDEVVAGQPVAYTAPAVSTPRTSDGDHGHGTAAGLWRNPLRLLRQRSASLLASLHRMSSSNASATSVCTAGAS